MRPDRHAMSGDDLVSGESRFILRVSRGERPATFWLVVVTWILMSAL